MPSELSLHADQFVCVCSSQAHGEMASLWRRANSNPKFFRSSVLFSPSLVSKYRRLSLLMIILHLKKTARIDGILREVNNKTDCKEYEKKMAELEKEGDIVMAELKRYMREKRALHFQGDPPVASGNLNFSELAIRLKTHVDK